MICKSKYVKYIISLLFFIFLTVSSPISIAGMYHPSAKNYKLPDGLTLILEEDHSVPLVNLQVWVHTGSVYEGRFTGSGISHLIEHMVFKGNRKTGAEKLAKELQGLGGELSGATSWEYTHYGITVPKKNIKKTIEVVWHIITQAEFQEKELAGEKQVIRHEMAGIEDDPHKFLFQRFFRMIFQGHPMGEPVIGEKPLFDRLTRADIMEYYHSRYIPQNITLVITGDFDVSSLKSAIENVWSKNWFSEKTVDVNFIPRRAVIQAPGRRIIPVPVSKPYLIIGFYGPSISSPDMYPMDVLAEIAAGSPNSPLVKKMRDKLRLVSSINAWSYTPNFTGVWAVDADVIVSDWKQVITHILKELYLFKKRPVTLKEITKAKKRIIHKYILSIETIEGKGEDLGTNQIYTGIPEFTERYINGIRNVSVSDIKRVAKKYFRSSLLNLCVLQPQTEQMLFKKTAPFGIPVPVTRLQLSNGMRILINQDHNLPLVSIRLTCLGGVLEEDKPGLSYFFTRLWQRVDSNMADRIENKGGDVSWYSGNNSFGISINVLKGQACPAIKMLRAFINKMPVTKKDMKSVKTLQQAKIIQENDKIYQYSFNLTKKMFFGDMHPYRNSVLGNKRAVAGISKSEVTSFRKKYLVPSNMVLTVSGDVNAAKLITDIKNKFGGLEGKKVLTKNVFSSIPVKNNRYTEYRDTKDVIITLAYPGVSIYSKDRFPLEILEQLFSGLAGRLFNSIRGQKALSYSQGAVNFMGREPGAFIFYTATSSSGVNESIEILKRQISDIKRNGISEDDLQRSKNYFVTRMEQQLETNSSLSLELSLDELYGLGWDYYIRHIRAIKMVTADSVKDAANKYFRDDWCTLSIIGPYKIN